MLTMMYSTIAWPLCLRILRNLVDGLRHEIRGLGLQQPPDADHGGDNRHRHHEVFDDRLPPCEMITQILTLIPQMHWLSHCCNRCNHLFKICVIMFTAGYPASRCSVGAPSP